MAHELRAQSIKCKKIVAEYTKDKAQCIMLYGMNPACVHNKYGSVGGYIDHIAKVLKHPGKYLSITKSRDIIKRLSQHNMSTKSDPICDDCIITFWSNPSIRQIFKHHSSQNNPAPQIQDIDILKRGIEICLRIEILNLWHAFMMNHHFVKYYLFSYPKLLPLFLKYLLVFCQLKGKGDPDFPIESLYCFGYCEYMFQRFTDIFYCLFSNIKYINVTNLMAFDHWTTEIWIHRNEYIPNDYFQAVVQLLTEAVKLIYRAQCFQSADEMSVIDQEFVLLGIHSDDWRYVNKIRRRIHGKLMKSLRCGNYTNCQRKNKSHSNLKMKVCSRCKITSYCSRTCQKYHWKMSHRLVCIKLM